MLHAASKPRFTAPEILELVKIAAGSEHQAGRIDHGAPLVQVNPHALPALFLTLRDHSELKLEQLIDVTAVHWPLEKDREFEVIWQFRSITNNLYTRVSTRIADGEHIASATSTYASANYLEREVFDLFGIYFKGHPNMQRILLPDGYEGHPLRKEYPVEGPNFPEDAHRNDMFGDLDPDDFWSGVTEEADK